MMSVMYQEFSYDFPTPLASGAYGTDALEAGRRLLCLPSTQLRRHGATLAPGLVTRACGPPDRHLEGVPLSTCATLYSREICKQVRAHLPSCPLQNDAADHN